MLAHFFSLPFLYLCLQKVYSKGENVVKTVKYIMYYNNNNDDIVVITFKLSNVLQINDDSLKHFSFSI